MAPVPPTTLPFVVSDSCEPTWAQFYNDTLEYENGKEAQLQYYNTIGSVTPLPNLYKITVQNYPQFDLGIPDQYRVDVWEQDFAKDVAAGTVPQLEFLWIMSDHTTGPPNATAEQADNDLAIGRVIDIISHSSIWSYFGDLHRGRRRAERRRPRRRSPQPWLCRQPLRQSAGERRWHRGRGNRREHLLHAGQHDAHDRADPRSAAHEPERPGGLADDGRSSSTTRPQNNFLPWTHVPNEVPLCYGVSGYTPPSNIPPSLNTCSSSTTAALQDSPKVKLCGRAGSK